MARDTIVKLTLKGDNKDAKKSIDELSKVLKNLETVISSASGKVEIEGDASGAIEATDLADKAIEDIPDENITNIDGDAEGIIDSSNEAEDMINDIPEEHETEINGDSSGAIEAASDATDEIESIPEEHETEITADTSSAMGDINSLQDLAVSAGAAISAALTFDALFELSGEIDEMAKYSAGIGEAVENVNGLTEASGRYGVDNIQGLLKKNTKAMSEASLGTKAYSEAYDNLGISIYNTDGTMKGSSEIFEETVKAISKIEDPSERATQAQEIFKGSYQDVLRIVDGGADSFFESADAYTEMSAVTEESAATFETMNDTFADLDYAIRNLKTKAFEPFAAILTDVVSVAVDILTGGLEDLRAENELLFAVIDFLLPIVAVLGGAFATYAIGTGLATLATTALGIASGVTAGFIALLTSPISLVIIGIGLFVYAIIKLLDHFGLLEPAMEFLGLAFKALGAIISDFASYISKKLGEAFEWISQKAKEFWDWFSKTFKDEIDAIIKIWNWLVDQLEEIFGMWIKLFKQIIDGDYKAAWETFKKIVRKSAEVFNQLIGKLWEVFKSFVSKLWEIIKTSFANAWEKFKEIVRNATNSVIEWIKSIPGKFSEMVSALWERIKTRWNNAWIKFKELAKNAVNATVESFKSIPSKISSMISSFSSLVSSAWSSAWRAFANTPISAINLMLSGIERGMNSMLSGISSAAQKAAGIANKVPGVNISVGSAGSVSLPRVPYFAKGGIVDGAGLGVIGEAGPEMILPLNNQGAAFFDKILGDRVNASSGSSNSVSINIQGDMVAMNPEEMRSNILNDVDEYLGSIYA